MNKIVSLIHYNTTNHTFFLSSIALIAHLIM